jgi:hypothetical protein
MTLSGSPTGQLLSSHFCILFKLPSACTRCTRPALNTVKTPRHLTVTWARGLNERRMGDMQRIEVKADIELFVSTSYSNAHFSASPPRPFVLTAGIGGKVTHTFTHPHVLHAPFCLRSTPPDRRKPEMRQQQRKARAGIEVVLSAAISNSIRVYRWVDK